MLKFCCLPGYYVQRVATYLVCLNIDLLLRKAFINYEYPTKTVTLPLNFTLGLMGS